MQSHAIVLLNMLRCVVLKRSASCLSASSSHATPAIDLKCGGEASSGPGGGGGGDLHESITVLDFKGEAPLLLVIPPGRLFNRGVVHHSIRLYDGASD